MLTRNILVTLLFSTTLGGCTKESRTDQTISVNAAAALSSAANIAVNPLRQAYFGDLHVHTGNSFDAYVFGTRRTPDEAYLFAKGESIPHDGGGDMQIQGGPLDFYAVTDHGEYLGVTPAMADPNNPLSKTMTAQGAFGGDRSQQEQTFFKIGLSFVTSQPLEDIYDKAWINKTWQDTVDAANRHYEPGKFTTFAGYEFTAMQVVDLEGGGAANLHRNVIFANEAPDTIFTTLESRDPAALWRWMDKQRGEGREVLAIPHNSNGSNGMMFSLFDENGEPVSSEALASQSRNEPLVEITQIKGTSDTRPIFSPEDEWADFEHYPFLIGSTRFSTEEEGGYVRPTLGLGLLAAREHGVNPFDFGLIGSSDSHIAGGNYTESAYTGKFPYDGSGPKQRGSIPVGESWEDEVPMEKRGGSVNHTAPTYSAGALAGVWAESNTRESIFAAFKRKETFATTGPRMRVRFFAGDYVDLALDDAELVQAAYRQGVAMGSKLTASEVPTMLVWAARDPLSAPLQRVQVIKVWRDAGEDHREKIFDVACSGGALPDAKTHRCPDNGSDIDEATCELAPSHGNAELKAKWRDPEWIQDQSAVYYVRVLEDPSCRWSTWDAVRNGTAPNPRLPISLQERAWSSPIWIN